MSQIHNTTCLGIFSVIINSSGIIYIDRRICMKKLMKRMALTAASFLAALFVAVPVQTADRTELLYYPNANGTTVSTKKPVPKMGAI